MIAIETIVKTVIILVTIAIAIAGSFYIYNTYVYPALNVFDFAKLPSGVQQKVNDNWNSLIANINSCYDIVDYGCLCSKGFPGFNATFPSDCKLELNEKNISLKYGNSEVKSEAVVLRGASMSRITAADKSILSRYGEGYIDFKGKPLGKEVYPAFIIRNSFNFVISDKFYKTDPKTVNFLLSSTFDAKLVPEDLKVINGHPKCLNWRQSEIVRFDDFAKFANSNVAGKFDIHLRSGYTLSASRFQVGVGETPKYQVMLKYEKDMVRRYNQTTFNSEFTAAKIPSACNALPLNLVDGDSVELLQKDGDYCLRKA
jgi:hypothetical protein